MDDLSEALVVARANRPQRLIVHWEATLSHHEEDHVVLLGHPLVGEQGHEAPGDDLVPVAKDIVFSGEVSLSRRSAPAFYPGLASGVERHGVSPRKASPLR